MFALSKYMCFIVIFTSVFGLFIFAQFKGFFLYVHIRHLRICPSHVLMSFLDTLNFSTALILAGRESQIFGSKEARLSVPIS